MANCLILLAQSASYRKLISKKNTEPATATAGAGRAEFYVSECETCNRNFPSFQALGGHGASRKKSRAKRIIVLNVTILNHKEDQGHVQFNKVQSGTTNNNKAKIHECSTCGSEFSSGQALGGHMRRHGITTPTTNGNSIVDDLNSKPIKTSLQLDLNLPAPEDDHMDSNFPFVLSSPALVDCHY